MKPKTWSKTNWDADHYIVEFNGKREGPTCVEAVAHTSDTQGWVRRVWYDGPFQKDKKFYGNVHIVKVK